MIFTRLLNGKLNNYAIDTGFLYFGEEMGYAGYFFRDLLHLRLMFLSVSPYFFGCVTFGCSRVVSSVKAVG